MYQIILNFPKQFLIGIEAAKNIKLKNKFKGVVICGMGGSILPGEVLEMLVKNSEINLPLYVTSEYSLPKEVSRNHLVVCISYSGDTEETLSTFLEARRKKLPLVAVSSGGKLTKLCQKYGIPLAKMPSNLFPARLALGCQFGALMKILSNNNLIKNGLKDILILEKALQPRKIEKKAQGLAKSLVNKIPIIYSSSFKIALAKIWEISFVETVKVPSFFDCFPRLSHDGMRGFARKIENKKFHFIILRDEKDHPRVLKQMEITEILLEKRGFSVEFLNLEGKNLLEKIFSNVILAFLTAYYLALESRVDPMENEMVREFKKRLKEN